MKRLLGPPGMAANQASIFAQASEMFANFDTATQQAIPFTSLRTNRRGTRNNVSEMESC